MIAGARISKLQLPSTISQANKDWIHFPDLLGGRTSVCFYLAGIWSKTERTEGAAVIPFIWRRVTKQGLDGWLTKLNERFPEETPHKRCPSWDCEQLLCLTVKGAGMPGRLVHGYWRKCRILEQGKGASSVVKRHLRQNGEGQSSIEKMIPSTIFRLTIRSSHLNLTATTITTYPSVYRDGLLSPLNRTDLLLENTFITGQR